jgi:arginyl-tRNA synthetase
MASIEKYLTHITQSAFYTLGGVESQNTFGTVHLSDRPDLSDYQCNGALSFGKKHGKNPRDIAESLQKYLIKSLPEIEVSIAGPGFLNFKLSENFLVTFLEKTPRQETIQSKKTVVLDYGGPNVAKPMHVGHLRSSIIGESLKRLCQYKGYKTISDIHLGDWGTQMGMLIIALKNKHPDWVYFDENFKGNYPDESPVSLENLQEIYPKISAACKEDPDLSSETREATYELQQGRAGYRALWQHFVDISIADMKKNFEKLGVSFDQWFGESRYQEKIPALIRSFENKGVVEKSQGALIINVEEESDKKEMPPLILQKSDGGFLYATTDLATLDERVKMFKADHIIYVVDGRQRLHFQQVFRASKKMGYKVKTDFIGFGTMNGPNNKPFKTRSGGVMRLEDLIESLTDEALKKMEETSSSQDLSDREKRETAEKIGIAALKFADLQHNPVQNYQFDLKKFMSFEGKTGPYLLYAVVRMTSILKKTKSKARPLKNKNFLPQEREVLLKSLQAEDFFDRAFEAMSPHILCDYAFSLAQSFSRFYQACPILSEEDADKKETRIFLCAQVLEKLKTTLNLLGITPVSKM